jgi:tetratricopeptide (TPR) repeat protein
LIEERFYGNLDEVLKLRIQSMSDKVQAQKQLKDIDEHIAQLKNSLTQNDECGTTHYNLAVAYMGKQEYVEAEKELHDAIECSPTLAEAYVLLGGICLQRKDLEGCYRYNLRATKARAGFAEGYSNIGFVLLQLIDGKDAKEDEQKMDKAIKNLKKAIIHNKNFVQAYTTLGSAYFMKGLVKEGIKANLEAVKIQPQFPVAHNNLAVAYLEIKEFDKAIEHCDKAEKLGFEVAQALKNELASHRKNINGV